MKLAWERLERLLVVLRDLNSKLKTLTGMTLKPFNRPCGTHSHHDPTRR
jgi:hypothetical protein